MVEMFSKITLFELAHALDFQTHDDVRRFSLEFHLEDVISGQWIKKKKTSIADHMISTPDAVGPNGSALPIEIIEYLIKNHSGFRSFSETYPKLVNSLNRDGFELTKTGLKKKLPTEIPVAEQEDQLISLLKKFDFNTALGHYNQAIAAHARGEWAAANGQLRPFVEEIFNRTQAIVCPGEHSSSHEKRIALAKAGFFSRDYNEFLFDGTGFVEGFWKRLHPEGSHPGLSEQSDSTFRLHLVILVIHHFLTRLAASHPAALLPKR